VGNVSAARKGAHKIIVCLGCPFVAAGATPGDDSYGSGRALQALPQWVRFPPSPRSGMWCKGERQVWDQVDGVRVPASRLHGSLAETDQRLPEKQRRQGRYLREPQREVAGSSPARSTTQAGTSIGRGPHSCRASTSASATALQADERGSIPRRGSLGM
jgi:hypothetical protein